MNERLIIERLTRQRDSFEHQVDLKNDGLREKHREIERLRAALKGAYKLAGGHAIECQCRQCEIFEFLEPIVGNSDALMARKPAAWLVKSPDRWRYLGSTREDAERTQRETGGVIVPLYEGSAVETSKHLLSYEVILREIQSVAWADPEPGCTVESLLAWLRAQLQDFTASSSAQETGAPAEKTLNIPFKHSYRAVELSDPHPDSCACWDCNK